MNDKNQNFGELKRLLKLKQHEVPPPGYFNGFSGMVVSRIQAGEAREARSAVKRLADDAPWILRFLRFFEASPGVVGGFATSLCLLLIFGVVITEHTDTASSGAFAINSSASFPAQSSSQASASLMADSVSGNVLTAPASGGITVSTNPLTSLQPVASLFGQSDSSAFQTASFAPASGN